MWNSLAFGQELPDFPLSSLEVEVFRLEGKLLAAVLHSAHHHRHGSPARRLETNARVTEPYAGKRVRVLATSARVLQMKSGNLRIFVINIHNLAYLWKNDTTSSPWQQVINHVSLF